MLSGNDVCICIRANICWFSNIKTCVFLQGKYTMLFVASKGGFSLVYANFHYQNEQMFAGTTFVDLKPDEYMLAKVGLLVIDSTKYFEDIITF